MTRREFSGTSTLDVKLAPSSAMVGTNGKGTVTSDGLKVVNVAANDSAS